MPRYQTGDPSRDALARIKKLRERRDTIAKIERQDERTLQDARQAEETKRAKISQATSIKTSELSDAAAMRREKLAEAGRMQREKLSQTGQTLRKKEDVAATIPYYKSLAARTKAEAEGEYLGTKLIRKKRKEELDLDEFDEFNIDEYLEDF